MAINRELMNADNKRELRIWYNQKVFYDNAIENGTFTIKGHELLEAEYMDGWNIRIYGETIPLYRNFVSVIQGKKILRTRYGIGKMPSISLAGKWLEEAGFYSGNSFTMEISYSHIVLKAKRKQKTSLPLNDDEVPEIYLEGERLYYHGFTVGEFAKVDVHASYIVITPIHNSPHNPDSFIRWQKAHGRRGIAYFPRYYESLSYSQKKNLSR